MCIYCSIRDLVEAITPTLVTLIICATLVVLFYSCYNEEYKKKQQNRENNDEGRQEHSYLSSKMVDLAIVKSIAKHKRI